MKLFKTIFTFTLLLQQSLALAESYEMLSTAKRLKRLSILTTGEQPSFDLIERLKTLDEKDSSVFFNQISKDYVQSPHFNDVMVDRMSDLFMIKKPLRNTNVQFFAEDNRFTSLHLLFHRIVSENRSWDELLTSQVVGQSSRDGKLIDERYYEEVSNESTKKVIEKNILDNYLKSISDIFKDKKADQAVPAPANYTQIDSPQIAGVLSDPHFLDRYPTTTINQNRKRAAAIFNIFLCDEIRAVILPDESVQKELDEIGFDQKDQKKSPNFNNVQRHADDPKCSTCHYKLDPLANVFKSVSGKISKRSVPGYLSFKRKSGELVKIKFNHAQDLAQALVSQPEYAGCQVRHFWDWFIGSDVSIDAETEQLLIAKFNELERKPKDFVRYLVNMKSFYQFPKQTEENINFHAVSGLMKNCQSCHDSEVMAPKLDTLPFSNFGDKKDHSKVIDKLISSLDLLGDGSKASMPPINAGWKVSSSERAKLLVWLSAGAPDDSGEKTWHNESIREKVKQRVQAENIHLNFKTSFGNTAKRRMRPKEVASSLLSLSRVLGLKEETLYSRYYDILAEAERVSLINLNSGEYIEKPDSKYILFLKGAANRLSNGISENLNDADKRRQILIKLNLSFLAEKDDNEFGRLFYRLKNEERTQINFMIALALYERIIGLPAAPGSKQYEKLKMYAERIDVGASASGVITNTVEQLIISNDYLNY